ncbi:rod shape-determining protein [Candidatus Aerophobetes bacterium]|nr:rod shape-determining protein [Candidatus Aerophobetes bacterium]
MRNFGKKIGIDLGTTSTIVYLEGKGVVCQEPSVVAIDTESKKILAIGKEAREMLGRTPGTITAMQPMKDGVIADYDIVEEMLSWYIKKVCGRWELFHPYLMVCIPTGGTSVEKRAVINAGIRAGAKRVFLIEEPKAAAIGANLDITKAEGSMIIDVGGGTTDVAVLCLGDIVTGESIRVGGNKMDEAIMRYVRKKYNIALGEISAEMVKEKIGYAIHPPEEEMQISGRDLLSGLPKTIKITAKEICEVLSEPLSLIMTGIRNVLGTTPPELAADIINRRIVLTGGGSLLKNFDKLVEEQTGIPALLAEDPISCVAIGTGKALKTIKLIKDTRVG